MILKTYQKYLIKEFLFFILKVTFVFFILGFIMGILEELRFFSDIDEKLQTKTDVVYPSVNKSKSLRGVLEPFSDYGNMGLLKRAGFKDIQTIFHHLCFKGYLCIK